MAPMRNFKLALICGGPSQERGISLNSARSIMDHLKGLHLEIIPFYVDHHKQFYLISQGQLYSNTPADFDFKLHQTSTRLDFASLIQALKNVDLVFPVIHGYFGEDGELQSLLEQYQVPFIGSNSASCQWMFRKHQATETLRGYGFSTFPQAVFSHKQENYPLMIKEFFQKYTLKRAIVKPSIGGSSIGVYSVKTPQEACQKLEEIFFKGLDQYVLIEPFCEGQEFTIVVFENHSGEPIALIPTEIDLSYENNQIFDYRKKYLPTNQAAYHTPPNFTKAVVERIRIQAQQIFYLFGMRDFVRLDGWVMKDGTIYFTDINPMSGLEQNSFLFRQTSILGMTHRQSLEYILRNACQRYGLDFPSTISNKQSDSKLPIHVLFGSHNAERQVSLMSGTNVWLKLLQSKNYQPIPFFLDSQRSVWELPYSYTLNHTVEEIYANCLKAQLEKEKWQALVKEIKSKLGIHTSSFQQPQKMNLEHFLELSKQEQAFVFIALHGGEGENGTLQKYLEKYQIPFNGSNAQVSALCMDKYLTGQVIQKLEDDQLTSIPRKSICLNHFKNEQPFDFEKRWQSYCQELKCQRLIIKPRCDGCSAGIVLLQSSQDLERYCDLLYQNLPFIPAYSFTHQVNPIEMPSSLNQDYLLEPYIETDEIIIEQNQLKHLPKEGWLELTIGVLEQQGIYHAFNPSITIAEGSVLSLEEKFQGGTGVNLTPPPEEILSPVMQQKIKSLAEKAAKALGIENYARLDIFFNYLTEKMILIEANTLPGLTPSTVIYHQGLAEESALTPLDLLEKIISSKLYHFRKINSYLSASKPRNSTITKGSISY